MTSIGRILPLLLLLATTVVVERAFGATAAWGDELVDRIVAVVDDDPIFLSDVERVLRLGLKKPAEGESSRELQRRVLDELIDERLRLHEVERFDTEAVSADEIDGQVAHLAEELGGRAELLSQLDELGLDEESLRHLLRRQLRVMAYIEERLSPRVFVDFEEIRSYYDDVLAPEMARQGIALPPLSEVQGEIRVLLREQGLSEEIEAWTEELRLAADIVDYLDRGNDELPPVVRRIDGE